ncbi:hypothetical protein ACP4J4_01975 [Aureimonas ureilytica]|uniref:hypothetical protein n=1 Tax=Aureimonas ureilytica TaxID=401562 RepID=UPI003CEB44AF
MNHRRFSARQAPDGTWAVFDSSEPVSFGFCEELKGIPEERALFLVDLLNTLELRRTARQAALVRRPETVH